MRIEAINSVKAGAIDDDDFGLVKVLILWLGARGLITKNSLVAPMIGYSTAPLTLSRTTLSMLMEFLQLCSCL